MRSVRGLIGPNPARVVYRLGLTLGGGHNTEHIVIDQHDQHAAVFQRAIEIDQRRAGIGESSGSLAEYGSTTATRFS